MVGQGVQEFPAAGLCPAVRVCHTVGDIVVHRNGILERTRGETRFHPGIDHVPDDLVPERVLVGERAELVMDRRGGLLLVAAPYSSRTRSPRFSPTCSAALCAPRSPARHRGPCQRGANARAQGSSRCASNNTFARYTPAISPSLITAARHQQRPNTPPAPPPPPAPTPRPAAPPPPREEGGGGGELENPAHVTVTRI